MNKTGHNIDIRLLERYSVYLAKPGEPDFDGSMLSKRELRQIGKHLKACDRCRIKMQQFQAEFTEIEHTLNVLGLPDIPIARPGILEPCALKAEDCFRVIEHLLQKYSTGRVAKKYLFAATVTGVLALLLLPPLFSLKNDHSYLKYAELERIEIPYAVRGERTGQLQNAIIAFNDGQYREALLQFSDYFDANPEPASRSFANYLLGLSHLYESQKISGEQSKLAGIDKAIVFLKSAAALTENNRILENCYWFTAKAYLLKRDGSEASAFFKKIINLRGRRMNDAKKILQEINKIVMQQ